MKGSDAVMVLLQLIITLIVPVFMIYFGRRNRLCLPEYGKRGISYFSTRAKSSPEAWNEANRLFASLLFACGINVGIISFVFFVIVVWLKGPMWVLCITFFLVQLIGSLLLIIAVTEAMLRRMYDENGEFRVDEETEEDETSGHETDQNASDGKLDESDSETT